MPKINFLAETEAAIKASGKDVASIAFIGSRDTRYGCTWQEFKQLANFDYNSTASGVKPPRDLVIVFDNGSSLSRIFDSGTERWLRDAVTPGLMPPRRILKLQGAANRTVAEINLAPSGEARSLS